MLRRLLAVGLAFLAAGASAAPPGAWTGRGCDGCHDTTDIQSWPTRPFLQGLDGTNFVTRLNAQGGVMATLATDGVGANGPVDRAAILAYLLDVRDGKVTNSGGVRITSLGLAEVVIGAAAGSTADVVITNERTRSITYAAPTISAANGFSITGDSCGPTAPRTVVAGGTCTLTIRFLPQAPPSDTEVRTANLNFSLTGTGGDPSPGAKAVTLTATARTPLEVTSPLSLSFNVARPGTSATQVVSIANRLGADLRLCLVDRGAFPAPADFNLVGRTYDATPARCATVAGPGVSPTQSISFTPTVDGPRFARLTVQRLGAGGVAVGPAVGVDLEGNAGPFANLGGADLSGNALFTGVRQDVNAGATTPRSVTLTNVGSDGLRVSSVVATVASGTSTAEYAITGCTAGTVLATGGVASCSVSVTFDPVLTGARAAQLQIGYSDPVDTPSSRRTAVIDVAGIGTRGAALAVLDAASAELPSGSTLVFGSQNLAVSTPRLITLVNVGTDEALEISSAGIVPSPSAFAQGPSSGSTACPVLAGTFTLLPGASCVADLRFTPTAVASYVGTLTLASRPAGSSASPAAFALNFTGSGVDGRPRLEWQTTAGAPLSQIDVPGVTVVGSTTPPQVALRLANQGPGAAALTLLNVVGADASSFVIASTGAGQCGFGAGAPPLAEGTTCAVTIGFQPQSAGAKNAALQLTSSGTTPAPVQLTGQASGPASTIAVGVAPASVTFDAIRVGSQSLPSNVAVTNNGTLPVVVSAVTTTDGFAFDNASCGAAPFTLAPAAACSLTVRFNASSVGTTTGALRLAIVGASAPAEVQLTGTGTAAADVSSGGCTLASGRSALDPTLWTLVALAIAVLVRRHRRAARGAR